MDGNVMPALVVGNAGRPWFGPRVFDDAGLCPAKAAVALRNFGLPPGTIPERVPKFSGGAWLAAADLLRALAGLGPTSAYAAGRHAVTDLYRLAASVLPNESRPVREFAAVAVDKLLEHQGAIASVPFDHYPVFIKMPFGYGEMHAGGAFAFRGPAGMWQVWRLRMTTARPVGEASRNWALIAAYCLAGHLDHEQLDQLQAVEAFEIGAGNGSFEQLGLWTRTALHAEFEALRKGRLRDMASDLLVRPGSHCADCRFAGACPAAPRTNGLLQLVPRQPAIRKVSATDLRTHADCARRYQLLSLHGLPREPLTGEALLRGQLLDAWLQANHMRGIACSEADVQRFLAETSDAVGAAMAGRHLGICPLADPATSGLTVDTEAVALDAASRVMLVARPDAVYLRDTAVVWRETKTRTRLAPYAAEQLVATDVTAALYLVVLASGACGTPDALEWEELGADSHELTVLPADDRDLLDAARAHLSAAVADLLSDDTYPARPGVKCAGCAARRWCADAP
jgi:PD-(D/E)XK nuclease superfamily